MKQLKNHTYAISSSGFQKAVRLEASVEGHFSANYFDLLPSEVKEVVFYPSDESPRVDVKAEGMGAFIK